jgi:hypothetical protein
MRPTSIILSSPTHTHPSLQADILDMALMDGAPVLATVSDDGEACVWSIESGALRRRLVPDNHK